MNNRVIACLAALLGCNEGSPRTATGPEPGAAAVAEAVPAPPAPGKANGAGRAASAEAKIAPPQPVKGTVNGEPFEVKAALALHRWRGGEKNFQLYDVLKTCAETKVAPGSVCRRDSSGDRTKKTANGMTGTFGDLGRCVPSSPTP
jgi:hypothetical protein